MKKNIICLIAILMTIPLFAKNNNIRLKNTNKDKTAAVQLIALAKFEEIKETEFEVKNEESYQYV